SSCSKKDDASTHYRQKRDVNSTPAWRIRSVDIRDMDPLKFLSHLQTMEHETAQIPPVQPGWVKEADLPKLFALLDSQKKCAAVVAPDWSPHMAVYKGSTVRREAGFLIKSFREQWYPASLGLPITDPYPYPAPLGSTISDADKEDLRKWWAQYQDERD
ncbi:MAG: hypothetical protein JSW47_07780, partial [Phycisphaerales bacterium]